MKKKIIIIDLDTLLENKKENLLNEIQLDLENSSIYGYLSKNPIYLKRIKERLESKFDNIIINSANISELKLEKESLYINWIKESKLNTSDILFITNNKKLAEILEASGIKTLSIKDLTESNEYKEIEKDPYVRTDKKMDVIESSENHYFELSIYLKTNNNITKLISEKINNERIELLKEISELKKEFKINDIYTVENNNDEGVVINISCNFKNLQNLLKNNLYLGSFNEERIKIRLNLNENSQQEKWQPNHFTSSVYYQPRGWHQFPEYITRPLKEEKNTYQLYEKQSASKYDWKYYYMSLIAYSEHQHNEGYEYNENLLKSFVEDVVMTEICEEILNKHKIRKNK